jgi:predicted ATPase/DNA-binding SARP family transcriptional activator
VGRSRELEELTRLLDENRLLTLTGAGGSGKTRLALELMGQGSAGSLPPGRDRRAWIDLSSLDDPSLLPQHVLRGLGGREELRPGSPGAIVPFLDPEPFLLVLDNCEHLVEACAELVEVCLHARPQLKVVATSREALGLSGECAWLVPPLSLPEAGDSLSDPHSYEAVRLFEERARENSASFHLTEQNVAIVAEICRRLDGLPLAIELAAARVKVLSVEQIRDRLDDLFRLLSSEGRRTVARHRTLRAAIDWSHELLPEPARILLRRLSVFRGGFGLDGATSVGALGDGFDELETLDQVARLVDRSLVRVREARGMARYSLLETIRQYAEFRLRESDEEEETRARHARFMAERVEEAAPHLTGPGRQAHVRTLMMELDNLRAALSWSRGGAPELHVEMVGQLWWFWYSNQQWKEGGTWLEGALSLEAASPPTLSRLRLLFAAGALATLQGRTEEGRERLSEAAGLARSLGNLHMEAWCQNYLALGFGQQGDPRLRDFAQGALGWFQADEDPYGLRLALLMSALGAEFSGDRDLADRHSQAAIEVARTLGRDRDLAIALQNWSLIWVIRGEPARAEPLVLESMAALRDDPSYLFLARGLDFLAQVAGERGNPLRAARLMGLAEGLRESVGTRGFAVDVRRMDTLVPRLRAAADDEAFSAAWSEGRLLKWEEELDVILESWPAGGTEGSVPATDAEPASRAIDPESKPPLSPPPPTEGLRIRTLGPFELEGETVEAGCWSYARPRELLLFLLLHPKGASRAEIGGSIWPEATPSQLKNSFHVTLHHLRKQLGDPGWIVLEGERYRLARERGLDWDAERFETGVREAVASERRGQGDLTQLHSILELYRGELLDGDGSSRWIEEARDHYRRLQIDGWVTLARLLERAGRVHDALDAWHRVTSLEELNEEAHRNLMRGWSRTGARDRAIRHFSHLSTLLREAFDAEPEEETLELYQSLLSSKGPPEGG